ncbi:MAG: threonine/serine exporter family protein [Chitinophagaceae bacterium]|nr:threonine/serine exporter family protein [Oligoflexus sp.]
MTEHPSSKLNDKVDFIILLARSLQRCGAAAHHLERALSSAGKGLGLGNQYIAFPTGLIGSFNEGHDHRSTVIRFNPGSIDLSKLSKIDETADAVIAGRIDLKEGTRQIEAINAQPDDYPKAVQILAYALASGGFVTALHGSFIDLVAASALGIGIGILDVFGRRFSFFEQLFAGVAAFLTTLVATLLSQHFPSLSADLVILASIVVLLPGLTLIIAFVELSTKNLIAGTARLAGATGDLLKLVFTIAITKKLLVDTTHLALPDGHNALPVWSEVFGVVGLAVGFLILFRVRPKHAVSAFLISVMAYTVARFGSIRLGVELSFFATGALVALMSNLIARILHRPGLITLLPGIILIVPGSINYRGMTAMFQNNVMDTVQTSFSVVVIAISLVAGLFFGNAVVPPRRSL